DFEERIIRILPDARLLELTRELADGLDWMTAIVDPDGPNAGVQDNLRDVVKLLSAYLPGVLQFLHRFPLRLMPLERHRQILGLYSRDKVAITLWTRYTPPKWFPGAKAEELGEVHKRYLEVDDRSAPNG